MSQRPNIIKGNRESATGSAQREKVAQHPPMAGRGRGEGTRFGRANDAEGSSSQSAASQIVDPTQYQHQHQYEQPQYVEAQYEQPHQDEGEAHQQEAEA